METRPQTRPKGDSWPIDKVWKDEIKRLLKQPRDGYPDGISRAELARLLDVTPSAITILFQAKTKSTRLKAKIHKLLGLAPPTSTPPAERDELVRRLLRAMNALKDDDAKREHIVTTAEMLAASRQSGSH
jgi:hypothetical protein